MQIDVANYEHCHKSNVNLLFESVVGMFLYFFFLDSRYGLLYLFDLLLLHFLVLNQVVVVIHVPLLSIECQGTAIVQVNLIRAEDRIARGTKLKVLAVYKQLM